MRVAALVLAVVFLTGSLGSLNSPGAADDPLAATDDDLRAYIAVTQEMYDGREGLPGWQTLDAACDPDAVFSLLYLITTAKVGDLVGVDHFEDNPFLVAWDRDFADRYFAAYEAYHAGQSVPEPWRIAFAHADSGKSTVMEDLLLGMNAHVNYDLSFSAYTMGLPQNGQKGDYDRVNDAFWNVVVPTTNEMAVRYGYGDGQAREDDNLTAEDEAIVETLISWREAAWRNAEALAAAPGPLSRSIVAASIEAQAATIARSLAVNQEPTSQARLAHCQASGHPELLPELGGPGYGEWWFEEDFEKISFLICTPTGNGESKTIRANEHSWPAHERRGATMGPCEGDGEEDAEDEQEQED